MGNCTGGSNPPLSATSNYSRRFSAGFLFSGWPSHACMSLAKPEKKNPYEVEETGKGEMGEWLKPAVC